MDALQTGKVREYTSFLRDQYGIMKPGTPGRLDLYQNMRQLEREADQFERIDAFAKERGVSFDAANLALGAKNYTPTTASFFLSRAAHGLKRIPEQIGGMITRRAELEAQGPSWLPSSRAAQRHLESIEKGETPSAQQLFQQGETRAEMLTALERGPDGVRERYGELAADVTGSIAETLPRMFVEAQAGGTPLVFFDLYASNMVDGLAQYEEAKGDLDVDGHVYAHGKATIETGLTLLFGLAGKAVGLKTLEEGMTPAARAAVSKLAERTGINRLWNSLAGAGFEGIEESQVAAAQSAMDVAYGVSKAADPRQELVGALAGFFSAAGVDASTQLADFASRAQDTVRAAKDVEGAFESFTTTTFDAETATPAAIETTLPPVETGIPSQAEVAAPPTATEEAFAQLEAEGEGAGALATRVATFPEDIDEAVHRAGLEQTARQQHAQAQEYISRLTPNKLRHLMEQGTDPQLFGDITGIKDTTEDYRQSFLDTLETYGALAPEALFAQAAAPAVDQSLAESPLKGKTREEIRLRAIGSKLENVRHRIAQLREESRDARMMREEWLHDAGQLVQDNLPPETRGKFINAISKTRTPKRFNTLLDRVDKAVEKHERAAAEQRFYNAVSGIKNRSAEARSEIEEIVRGIDTKKRGRKAAEKIRAALETDPTAPLTTEQRRAVERLGKTPVKELPADVLQTVAEAVESAVWKDQMKHVMNWAGRQVNESSIASEIIQDTRKARGLRQRDKTLLTREEINPKRALASVDSPLIRELAIRPEAILEQISPTLKHQVWEGLLIDADDTYKGRVRSLAERLDSVMQRHGLSWKWGSTVFGMGGKATSPLEAWRETRARIGDTTLTRGEAAVLALNLRDESNARNLREKGAHIRVPGKRDRDIQITPEVEQQLHEFIGEAGLDMVDHTFSELQTTVIDPVNEAWELKEGHPLTTATNRVPRETEQKEVDRSDPSLFAQHLTDTTLEAYQHTKARQEAVAPLVIRGDLIEFFMRHGDRMARIASYLNPHHDTMKLVNRPDVKAAIESVAGDTGYKSIVDRINRQVLPPTKTDEANSLVKFINRNVTISDLALRIGAIVKQPVGLVLTATQTPGGIRRLLQTAPKMFIEHGAAKERMMRSPIAWDRFETDHYISEYTQGNVVRRGWFRPDPLSNYVSAPIKIAELEIGSVWRQLMAEQYIRDQGIPDTDPRFETEARKEWARMMYRGENSSEGLELSSLQAWARDNPYAYPVARFSSSATRVGSQFVQGADALRRGDKARGLALIGGAAMSSILVAAIDDLISREEVEGDWPERMAKRFVVSTVGVHPLGDEVLEPFFRGVMGMRVYSQDDSTLPGIGHNIAVSTARIINDIVNDEDVDPEKTIKAYEDLLIEASKPLGAPLGGARDLFRRAVTGDWLPGIQDEDDIPTIQ
jgi:hypothetical protein